MPIELDDVDSGILHMLQRDARDVTAAEIAEAVGVSPSTVRNRIDRLERDGVIRGYHPEIDYETANLPLRMLFICTAAATDRSELTDEAITVEGVVDLREMMTGRRNVHVEVVATSTADVARVADDLHAIGLEIESSELVKRRRMQPFNHFEFEPDADR